MPLQFARPKGKSPQAMPLLTSTDKGHGASFHSAHRQFGTGTLSLKGSWGGVSGAD